MILESAGRMDEEVTSVTHLLKAWSGGDQGALEELTPKVYLELRRMAARYMRREAAGDTLPATGLVHEVFLRLVDVDSVNWQDRAHFFAVSANMMRRILVDRARAKGMAKRGSAAPHVNLDDVPEIAAQGRDREIVAVDEAWLRWPYFERRRCSGLGMRSLIWTRFECAGQTGCMSA